VPAETVFHDLGTPFLVAGALLTGLGVAGITVGNR
jgi:hypothetical protein